MHPPRYRLSGELVFSILLLCLSFFLLWQAYGISGFESLTSAGAFPLFATLVLVVSGLVIVRQTARLERAPGAAGESLFQQFVRQVSPGVLVQFVVAITIYMTVLDSVGFVVSSYLFLVVSMWILGGRRLLLNLGVSALCLAAIYVIFQTVFAVVLPTGTLIQGLLK